MKIKGGGFIILLGPTGVGKTEVGFHLARLASGEIVSADSRLVYRGMDVGTAKPSPEMRRSVPHHLIDVVDPDDYYTCKHFERDARKAVREIIGRGRVPVVVGGSGLYIKALTQGVFEGPGRDEATRTRLREEAKRHGAEALWRRLKDVDPDKAATIDPANLVRLIRALEVYDSTGRPMSELERQTRPIGIPYVQYGLSRDRQELYRMIDERVDSMMETGFVQEVERLIEEGYGDAGPVKYGLGYREVIAYVEGAITRREAADLIKLNTRHLAKRQLTWFRNDASIRWLDVTGRSDYTGIASEVWDLMDS